MRLCFWPAVRKVAGDEQRFPGSLSSVNLMPVMTNGSVYLKEALPRFVRCVFDVGQAPWGRDCYGLLVVATGQARVCMVLESVRLGSSPPSPKVLERFPEPTGPARPQTHIPPHLASLPSDRKTGTGQHHVKTVPSKPSPKSVIGDGFGPTG